MRVVALEEHISLPALIGRVDLEAINQRGYGFQGYAPPNQTAIQEQLEDIEAHRLKAMDEAGITVQVLSVAGPGADLLEPQKGIQLAYDYNNALFERISQFPDRFRVFAHLPMSAPEAAADELERTVGEFGFCGALINGMTHDKFLDDSQFAPILARAEQLQVPLYLHPGVPPASVRETYYMGMSAGANMMLSRAGFGWHAEVAIHVLRLIASGVFDRYARLQIIIGHMGEMLPMMMERCDTFLPREVTGSDRNVTQILREQVHVTTSGMFSVPPLMAAVATFGIDRIMFSVDYPYSSNMMGRQFLDRIPLAPADVEKIAHGNADRLLQLMGVTMSS